MKHAHHMRTIQTAAARSYHHVYAHTEHQAVSALPLITPAPAACVGR
jgi:hypothetical protein